MMMMMMMMMKISIKHSVGLWAGHAGVNYLSIPIYFYLGGSSQNAYSMGRLRTCPRHHEKEILYKGRELWSPNPSASHLGKQFHQANMKGL